MKKLLLMCCFSIPLFGFSLLAEDAKSEIKDEAVITLHKTSIGNKEIAYKAYAGVMPIMGKDDKLKAGIFYVSYFKDQENQNNPRPITFCFNGGPGSSSVWLHMGALGPKKVQTPLGAAFAPPYSYIDNEYSILDLTDLVFIDPVSTGLSQTVVGEDPKQFHGVTEDIEAMAEFIRNFTTKYKRWDSPKYLVGESYGTTRAAGLALKLHDDEHYYLNGVVLISSILNFQTLIDANDGNDLPYILSFPTFTATAVYHKKLAPELLVNPEQTLKEAENFALKVYGPALLLGDLLPAEERKSLIAGLSKYSGLSELYIEQSNLRVSVNRFTKELLRDQSKTIGRFDSRYEGLDADVARCYQFSDPSFEAISGAYCATLNQYLRKDLNWEKLDHYKIISSLTWNYGANKNCYLNVGEDLREVMGKNPNLKVFVGSALYDLATPYFASSYTFNHLNLPPILRKNVTEAMYKGGHMMYTNEADLIKLKQDLTTFYNKP